MNTKENEYNLLFFFHSFVSNNNETDHSHGENYQVFYMITVIVVAFFFIPAYSDSSRFLRYDWLEFYTNNQSAARTVFTNQSKRWRRDVCRKTGGEKQYSAS